MKQSLNFIEHIETADLLYGNENKMCQNFIIFQKKAQQDLNKLNSIK